MNKKLIAELLLVVVALIWGLTFPLILDAVRQIPPSLFVSLRFSVALACFLPFFLWGLNFKGHGLSFAAGVILGGLNLAIYYCQSRGLVTIPASRSAFITGASVVLVPLLLPCFRLGWPSRLDCLSASLTLVGLFVLTGASFGDLTAGDGWTVACALSVALSIIVIQEVSKRASRPLLLAFYQVLVTTPLAWSISGHFTWESVNHINIWVAVGFSAVLATCVVFYIQMRFQQHTTASRAAVIYALEPVFATIFAVMINHEKFHFNEVLGGAIVFIGLCCPVWLGRS